MPEQVEQLLVGQATNPVALREKRPSSPFTPGPVAEGAARLKVLLSCLDRLFVLGVRILDLS